MKKKGAMKILLVDDSNVQLLTTELQLKNEYEIATAKSGKEALEYLTRGNVPDLIILDILMPDMDGWETFGRIKAISLLHSVPIFFLSSVNDQAEIDKAYNLGASGFLTKPYDAEDLLAEIKKVLDEKQSSSA